MKRPVFDFDNQYTFKDNEDRQRYIKDLEAYCDHLEKELGEAEDEIRALGEELDWVHSLGDDEDYY